MTNFPASFPMFIAPIIRIRITRYEILPGNEPGWRRREKKFSREPERKMIGGERRGKIGQKAKKCGKAIKDDIKAQY